MTDLKKQFVSAMGKCATGVSVITTDGVAGRMGVTVSAWCSVSAEPELVLCCINSRSPVIDAIKQNNVFCLNILSKDQELVANTFAGFVDNGKPFDFGCAEWNDGEFPSLNDSTASFSCEINGSYNQGTHIVFIGKVKSVTITELPPMVYYARNYCEATPVK